MATKIPSTVYFRVAVTWIFVFSIGKLFAQQDAQFTQYMFNGSFYNPALAGKDMGYRFSAIHRTQWLNYTTAAGTGGAPVTQVITAQGRLKSKNIGYGLVLVNDKIGATNNLELNLQGSYHKKINRSTLSFGGYVGVFSSSLDYGDLIVVNPEPNLPQIGKENQIALDYGAGVLLDRGNFYLGLSSKHINQPSFDFGNATYENQLKTHSYLLFGYRVRPIGPLRIEPSFLLKNVGLNNFSYNVSVMATHQNKINAGLAYRGEESVSLILGYSLLKDNSLKLGYAFDLVTGGLEAKSPTSHELMLRYTLTDKIRSGEFERVIQRTPRFRF
jgi:type IX secretion system PorP/SprF family membrane protein